MQSFLLQWGSKYCIMMEEIESGEGNICYDIICYNCVDRCCQQAKGGLRDKPGKPADYYHTCYCLSGLSSAQHYSNLLLGPADNLLRRTDPMCNIVEDKLKAAQMYFRNNPPS
jgi:hypothetical protein